MWKTLQEELIKKAPICSSQGADKQKLSSGRVRVEEPVALSPGAWAMDEAERRLKKDIKYKGGGEGASRE